MDPFDPPLKDTSIIDEATPLALAQGCRLFQSHRFSVDDVAHVDKLLDWFDPPERAHVIDMGCGVGETALIMSEMRPDLTFTLVNISETQLRECPTGDQFTLRRVDAHRTGMPDACADAVMFVTSLVQMDARYALREAHRLLHTGGVLFLSEMVRTRGDNSKWEPLLAGRVLFATELAQMLDELGFTATQVKFPKGDDSHFRELMGEHAEMLNDVIPSIWRMVKGNV